MAQNSKKVIIVGKTGNGKSSLGNNLLGMKLFSKEGAFNTITTAFQSQKYGNFEIVDTSGLFDTNQNQNVAQQAQKILHALKLCPAPHAFLIVIKYNTFTPEEVSALDVLQISFGEQYFDHAIVVVTHVANNVTDADFKNNCQKSDQMNELLERCFGRVVRIDNKNPTEEHVNKLLSYIRKVSDDGNSCFKNDYLRCHEEVLKTHADIDKYNDMFPHKQVEIIAKEIKTVIKREVENSEKQKKEQEREELEKKEQERIEKEKKEMENQLKEEENENKRKCEIIKNVLYLGSGFIAGNLSSKL